VDDFRVREPLGVDKTARAVRVGEPERVKPVVGGEGAVEVGQGLVGREEEGVVRAVLL
jgi:hypothetical protein